MHLVADLAAYLLLSPTRGVSVAGLPLSGALLFFVSMIAGILVHEGIHALAWTTLERLPLKHIRVGFHASTLTPCAHALDPMPARAYRLGAFMPALLLGVLPFVVGTAIGSASLALYGMIFVFAAGGDMLFPMADPRRRWPCPRTCPSQPGRVHGPSAALRLTARAPIPLRGSASRCA